MRALRVGVVGGGTAGPAAAILLAEAGHDVTVFERAECLEPVGAGLLLQPDGQWVLAQMGLLDAVRDRAASVGRLLGHTSLGRRVLDLAYADLAPRLVGLGVHRASLIQVLVERMGSVEGCRLECGVDIAAMERREDGWFLDGPSNGTRGPYDLVVLANGARSALRASTGLVRRAREYPWGALWTILPDPGGLFPDTLEQVYRSNDTFLGFLPTGRIPGDSVQQVSVFWSVRNDAVELTRSKGARALRDSIVGLVPRSAPVVDGLTSWEQWIHARYMDVSLRQPYRDGVVCIGDTAHAMSPQLGQGVTLALQDAWALAASLRDCDTLDAALAGYARERRSAVRFYQLANRAATWFFQGDSRVLAAIRDLAFGPMNHVPIYRGQMLRTLAGFKRGILDSHVRRQLSP